LTAIPVYKIYPLSESAVTIELGNSIDDTTHRYVMALNEAILQIFFEGFIETVPAYTTVTVYYNPAIVYKKTKSTPFGFVEKYIKNLITDLSLPDKGKTETIIIPVCYEEEFAPDLSFIANEKKISKEEVIRTHSSAVYKVYMIGFSPGFPYMGIVNDAIAVPRKTTPRAMVEAGSVGIAGRQTGIYSFNTPGGWQIIGRTPLKLFDITKERPSLLKPGDTVKFQPISSSVFYEQQQLSFLKSNELQNNYTTDGILKAIIKKPGIAATVQDGGRFGFQSQGVVTGGAMDLFAYRTANLLVGNKEGAAIVEITFGNADIVFEEDTLIAVCGRGADLFINGDPAPVWKTIAVKKGASLFFKNNNEGARMYLSVAGGWNVKEVMNSSSTCLPANFGGYDGRTLQQGDILKADIKLSGVSLHIISLLQPNRNFLAASWGISFPDFFKYDTKVIRVIEGNEQDWFDETDLLQLYSSSFNISNAADRMGYRLKGKEMIKKEDKELLSTAVTKGSVQVTPDGNMILLMSDCQTTGGYPRIAQVAAVDLPVCAQLKPGDSITFKEISFEEAEQLFLSREKHFYDIEKSIAYRFV
jgi:KipI family sensor histidine kinase inhibitor